MITAKALNRIRNGIVGIGYITEHWKAALNPGNPEGAHFNIVGTGFSVHDKTIITNRHVLEHLREVRDEKSLDDEQLWVSFYVGKAPMSIIYAKIDYFSISNNKDFDIGFVDIGLKPTPDMDLVKPLPIRGLESISVGQPIAVCGFPYGSNMLKRDNKVYRFGPVLQQGYISAIAPHDDSTPTEILLDVRTAPGMSGAPVFRPGDGSVIGIHYAGWEATTALAVPLNKSTMEYWLNEHKKLKEKKVQF